MKLKILIFVVLILFLPFCTVMRETGGVQIPEERPLNLSPTPFSISPDTPGPLDSPDLTVFCAVGMRQVMLDLLPKFEQLAGYRVSISFHSSGEIAKWVDTGRRADVVIIFRSALEQIGTRNKLITGSLTSVAISRVGVAVRKGAPRPDISSAEAFKKALLKAQTIACPDPARGGASGTYIAGMFKKLGIAEALKSKLVFASTPEDEHAMPGYLVATGKAEIALHQMQELLAVTGIDIVGPLPDEIQATFVFAAAVTTSSAQPAAAKELIRFLTTPLAKEIIKRKGMEMAGQ